jgi:hypothetical protein
MPRKICLGKKKKNKKKREKNDIKSNQWNDVLSVGNFMSQLADKCAIAYILFFFNFHAEGPRVCFDSEYILRLWILEFDIIPSV